MVTKRDDLPSKTAVIFRRICLDKLKHPTLPPPTVKKRLQSQNKRLLWSGAALLLLLQHRVPASSFNAQLTTNDRCIRWSWDFNGHLSPAVKGRLQKSCWELQQQQPVCQTDAHPALSLTSFFPIFPAELHTPLTACICVLVHGAGGGSSLKSAHNFTDASRLALFPPQRRNKSVWEYFIFSHQLEWYFYTITKKKKTIKKNERQEIPLCDFSTLTRSSHILPWVSGETPHRDERWREDHSVIELISPVHSLITNECLILGEPADNSRLYGTTALPNNPSDSKITVL